MSSDDPYHDPDELALAIGRVAMSSAEVDDILRDVLHRLTGRTDTSWIIFEGQSTDWLIGNIKATVRLKPPPEPLHRGLLTALQEINNLRVHRNWIVHGTWGTHPISDDPADYQQRPWGKLDDNQALWFSMRSTYRSYGKVSAWTVSDIELLASKYHRAGDEVERAYRRIYDHRFPDGSRTVH